MSLYRGNRRITRPIVNGQPARMLLYRGRQVWPCRGPLRLPPLMSRMVNDADGMWLEVGFQSPEELDGDASSGWTDTRGYCALEIESSFDLATWAAGSFTDCAGSPASLPDGSWEYWSRAVVPRLWENTMVDLAATTTRYGKSITAINVCGVAVDLPDYPYAMPGDAAELQSDLRAAGYPGAVVSVASGALTVGARNHTVGGIFPLAVTMAGASVTAVAAAGSTISLAGYPYAMPSQRAALQADLRSAGYDGSVVMLYGDTWSIHLPDLLISGASRLFTQDITPADPYPVWNFFGDYVGDAQNTMIVGGPENIRDPEGQPLEEAARQFARLVYRKGTRTGL